MKHKNDHHEEQTFGNFMMLWVAAHIGAIILMGAIYVVLLIPLLSQLGAIVHGNPLSAPWALYSAVIPSIILLIPCLGLGLMQARTSFNTLGVLPNRWVLYSCTGVILGACLYSGFYTIGLLTPERLGVIGYRLPSVFVGFVLVGMGLAQALVLFRQTPVFVPLGWLFIHIVIVVLLVATLDYRQFVWFLLLFSGTTGSLCWYVYKRPQSRLVVSQSFSNLIVTKTRQPASYTRYFLTRFLAVIGIGLGIYQWAVKV